MSLSAIKGLIIRLGGLREGKKALVLVSEGYSNYIPPQMQSMNGQVRGQGNAAFNDPFAGDGQQQQTLRFFGEAEMMGRLKDIYDLANRYNVSIYALDPRGLAAFEQDIDEGGAGISLTTDKEMLRMTLTSLQVLADNTDGRAIVNKNDLAARHAPDPPRSERLLPARVQLEQGARGRQVPRDQGQGEAARPRHPRAQGLRRLQSRGSQEGARADRRTIVRRTSTWRWRRS